MMKRILLLSLATIVVALNALAQWLPDHLGDGFEMRHIALPNDYTGEVRATAVRHRAAEPGKAVVYVHGYNDYFFQKEMAGKFVSKGYNFYAVDLRRYGRSLLEGQVPFDVRDIAEYFAEIDSVLSIAVADGNHSIALMGHSTGGLITSYYMAKGRGERYPIKALMLNSPFLDMNLSPFLENIAVPLVSFISPLFPNIQVEQSDGNGYAQSLLKCYHGEWDYNTNWKFEQSPDVSSAWLGAIHKAQVYLQGDADIKVPILLMYSAHSVSGDDWTPDFNDGDAVLDVADIALYGSRLGRNVHQLRVPGGLHDLFLSRSNVRCALYRSMFRWLQAID